MISGRKEQANRPRPYSRWWITERCESKCPSFLHVKNDFFHTSIHANLWIYPCILFHPSSDSNECSLIIILIHIMRWKIFFTFKNDVFFVLCCISPSRRTCSQDFYVLKKSIDLSRIWTREPWISRRGRYPETIEADKDVFYFSYNYNFANTGVLLFLFRVQLYSSTRFHVVFFVNLDLALE